MTAFELKSRPQDPQIWTIFELKKDPLWGPVLAPSIKTGTTILAKRGPKRGPLLGPPFGPVLGPVLGPLFDHLSQMGPILRTLSGLGWPLLDPGAPRWSKRWYLELLGAILSHLSSWEPIWPVWAPPIKTGTTLRGPSEPYVLKVLKVLKRPSGSSWELLGAPMAQRGPYPGPF